jgi:putative cell wall-binding protein
MIGKLAMQGTTVYVLGGEKAVSAKTAREIDQIDNVIRVTRISGSDRIATAMAIYRAGAAEDEKWGDTCIVVNGFGYADSLSIGSYAYAAAAPVFPTNKQGLLNAEQIGVINDHFENVIVCGGEFVVKSGGLEKLAGKKIQRLAGQTRCDTSMEIVLWTSGIKVSDVLQPKLTLDLNGLAVTNAMNYPDALVSVNLVGVRKHPLLLATDNVITERNIAALKEQGLYRGYILGGRTAVPDKVKSWLEK